MIRAPVSGIAVSALCFATTWFGLHGEAQGEEIGGYVTGKFNLALQLGGAVLLMAAVAAILRPKRCQLLTALGSLLILPMQTWRLAPGFWCSSETCSAPYPTFVQNGPSMTAVTCAIAAVVASRWIPQR